MYSVGMFALLMMMSGALFLGYTLVRAMSEDGLSPNYGRICDLNLGRVGQPALSIHAPIFAADIAPEVRACSRPGIPERAPAFRRPPRSADRW